jgi:hypothetical protein
LIHGRLKKNCKPKLGLTQYFERFEGIIALRPTYLLTDKAKFKGAKILHKENCHKDNREKPKRNHD